MIYFHPSSERSRVNQGNLSSLHFCDFSGKPEQHHQRTLNSGVMKAPSTLASRKIILHHFCEHALSRTRHHYQNRATMELRKSESQFIMKIPQNTAQAETTSESFGSWFENPPNDDVSDRKLRRGRRGAVHIV
jgi:hypothetical protein